MDPVVVLVILRQEVWVTLLVSLRSTDRRTADVLSSFINMSDVKLILDSARCREVGSNAIDRDESRERERGEGDKARRGRSCSAEITASNQPNFPLTGCLRPISSAIDSSCSRKSCGRIFAFRTRDEVTFADGGDNEKIDARFFMAR